MKRIIYTTCLLCACTLISCEQFNPGRPNSDQESTPVENDNHIHEEVEANPEDVHMVQAQMDVMKIELGKFQYLNLSTTVKSNGQLELPPQKQASLSSVVEGRVISINVVEGDFVEKDHVLALLEHPDFVEVQEEYLTAQSQLAYREKYFQRDKELHESGTISEKEYQAAEIEFHTVRAEVAALKAKLRMLEIDPESVEEGNFVFEIPIKAPIRGHVRHVEVNMGMYVQPGQEMFEIADNDHIHIDLKVYEKDMGKVRKGQKVIFSLTNSPNTVLQARIFAIGKSFEKEPNAMLVHAEIENKSGNLLPGMYVDARIVTNSETVRALPDDAIVRDGGLDYIFVLKPGSVANRSDTTAEANTTSEDDSHDDEYVFRRIEVNTGAHDIGFTEVVPAYNLPEHAQIVTKGAFYLHAEMKKGEGGGHGHHH